MREKGIKRSWECVILFFNPPLALNGFSLAKARPPPTSHGVSHVRSSHGVRGETRMRRGCNYFVTMRHEIQC